MVHFSSFFCLLMLAFFFIHSNISSLYVNSYLDLKVGWFQKDDPLTATLHLDLVYHIFGLTKLLLAKRAECKCDTYRHLRR